MPDAGDEIGWSSKLRALVRVARFRPRFSLLLVGLGGAVAVLEGVGLSFIHPIIEVAQSEGQVDPAGTILQTFLAVYEFFGVPFTLGYLIVGIAAVMTVRFTFSFLASWLKAVLATRYEQRLRTRAFDAAMTAEVSYFDERGSDDILNAIITETRYSSQVIRSSVQALETLFLVLVYLVVMLYITPVMTLFALGLLGGITFVMRHVLEPAYTVGSKVARANEDVQRAVQVGTQGIRDVKLFGLTDEVFADFTESIRRYTRSSIDLARNEAALRNFYDLAAALTLFVLIYAGFAFSGLSIGALGIFLFAMFRLSPLMSRLNSQVYKVEGNISHLVRTQAFIDELRERSEDAGSREATEIRRIEFDDVDFTYDADELILEGLSFEVEKGEFVGFVGQSGAGKSSIVSLLTRMYEPDDGEIRADGVPIDEYDLDSWRSRIAVVRQQPFVFNATLRENVTVGNRDAPQREIERVCEIAKVDEFFDDLPDGYDSMLGDDGVRLSGGQRQRVALARALLKDADLLVLDEATSDLDSNLEREVQQRIEAMDHEYAIMTVAHRLSTVQNADRIFTIDAGEIVETGTHEELLDNGGQYADLYAIQSMR